jgi:hypothetical protein
MPAGDGTGPMGTGPMTGRAAGFCAGFGMPGYVTPIPGRGFRLRQEGYDGQVGMGFGRGRGGRRGGGRGWRNMFYATGLTGWQRAAEWPMAGGVPPYATAPTREQQLEALKSQAEYFEGALGDLRKRMEELEAEKADK